MVTTEKEFSAFISEIIDKLIAKGFELETFEANNIITFLGRPGVVWFKDVDKTNPSQIISVDYVGFHLKDVSNGAVSIWSRPKSRKSEIKAFLKRYFDQIDVRRRDGMGIHYDIQLLNLLLGKTTQSALRKRRIKNILNDKD